MKQGGDIPRLKILPSRAQALRLLPKIFKSNPVNDGFTVVETFLPDEPRVAGRRRFDRRKIAVFRAFYAFAADMDPRGRVAVEQIVAGGGFQKLNFQKQAKQVSGGQDIAPVPDKSFCVLVRRIRDDVMIVALQERVEKIEWITVSAIDQIGRADIVAAFDKTLGEVSLAARWFPDVFRQPRFGGDQQISRRGFRRVVVFGLAVVRFISADCRQEKRGHAILSPSSMSKTSS